jgi:transcriptional regulator with XRE-family HTH domain
MRSMSDSRAAEKFGKIVRKLRKARGWTQLELALEAKADVAYVSRIERGLKNPSLETVLRFAKVFGVKAKFGESEL